MLRTSVHTVLPASDIERAKRFYAEKLDLKPIAEDAGGVIYKTEGGMRFTIYPTPNPNRGGHTQMGLQVENIEAAVKELRGKGVKFEEYDMPGLKTKDGIGMTGDIKAAWFKDTEGNTIGLIEFPEEIAAKL